MYTKCERKLEEVDVPFQRHSALDGTRMTTNLKKFGLKGSATADKEKKAFLGEKRMKDEERLQVREWSTRDKACRLRMHGRLNKKDVESIDRWEEI